jgi:hypothetical protein
MESMRASWTDERLDDFRGDVDHRFDRVDGEIQALRVESRTEFNAFRGVMKQGFERVDQRFEALYRLLLQLGGATFVALIGLIATQI